MGTYGTFSGWIRWFDNENEEGLLLGLKNGDVRIRGTADGTFEILDEDGNVVGELNQNGIEAANGNIVLDENGMIVHDLTNASIITPIFGVGRTQDVLQKSEAFDEWTAVGTASVTANTQISPEGSQQIADTISLPAVDDYIYRSTILGPYLQVGQSGVFSVWLRAATAGTIQIRVSTFGGTTITTTDVAVVTQWRRFSVTFTNPGGTTIRVNASIKRADSTQLTEVYAWGAQVTFGVTRAVPYWPLQNSGNGLESGMFVRGVLGVGGYQNQLIVGSGWSTIPTGARTVAVGFNTAHHATGADLIAIGNEAGYSSTGSDVLALGRLTTGSTFSNVILLGVGAAPTAANQIVIGSSTIEYTDLYGGGGVAQSTPPAWTIHATGGSGSNIAGGALKLAGGQGTGSGAGGSVVIQTAPAGGSGSGANALVDRVTIDSAGNVGIGTAPVAQSALQVQKTGDASVAPFLGAEIIGISYTGGANLIYGMRSIGYSQAAGAQTGTVYGVETLAANLGAGAVTALIGNNASVANFAAGNVTSSYVFFFNSPMITSTGTIGTAYGAYIAPQKVTGVTTGIGFWQQGASDLNYFAGEAGFNSANWTAAQVHITPSSTTKKGLTILGNASQTAELLHLSTTTPNTSTVQQLVTLTTNSDGTAAAGFGSRMLWELESSTTDNQAAAAMDVSWATATHASRKARMTFSAYDTAAREALRLEASGSAPMIGFLGGAAVVQQTGFAVPTNLATCISALTAIRTLLINYNLSTTV